MILAKRATAPKLEQSHVDPGTGDTVYTRVINGLCYEVARVPRKETYNGPGSMQVRKKDVPSDVTKLVRRGASQGRPLYRLRPQIGRLYLPYPDSQHSGS
jgi:hypothetical protein